MSKVYVGYPKEMNLAMEAVKDKLTSVGVIEDIGPRGFVIHPCTTPASHIVKLLRGAQGMSVVFAEDIGGDDWRVMLISGTSVDMSVVAEKGKNLF
jgi:hypothetical protein